MTSQTIYALSTVYGKSGVAVIRISGEQALAVLNQITDIDTTNIKPRYAYFTGIKDASTQDLLDKSLVLYFKAPHSFTGEDVVEIQCHGSKAVLNSVFKTLSSLSNLRLAEPGEFSKRAFYNQKMDLTEAEGLADLIDAETHEQQKYALRQMEGNLKNLYTSWRTDLVKILSYLEAFIDFPEEDIPETLYNEIINTVFKTKSDIISHLSDNNVNERLKNGFRVVIAGVANAGKSSLINALTKTETMIVSDIPGTTRDTVDINLDLNGYPVIITDTAGLRETENIIEKQGITRAIKKIEQADAIIVLYDASQGEFDNALIPLNTQNIIYAANKADKLSDAQKKEITQKNHLLISAKFGNGLPELLDKLTKIIQENFTSSSNLLITRTRYRKALELCLENLEEFSLDKEIVLSAEDIRLACRAIGQITGTVKVDEILDNIFGSFCIGK